MKASGPARASLTMMIRERAAASLSVRASGPGWAAAGDIGRVVTCPCNSAHGRARTRVSSVVGADRYHSTTIGQLQVDQNSVRGQRRLDSVGSRGRQRQ